MRTEHVALTPEQSREVRAILRAWAPGREVWAFGSRATGASKRYSDLDLAILGDEPLPAAARAGLVNAFEESDLPFRVDVVEWAALGEAFRAVVAHGHAVLQGPKAPSDSRRRAPSPSDLQGRIE